VRLDDRIAVVTGTSPNIGAGIALGLAEAGAHVACLDNNLSNAESCSDQIGSSGGRALAVRCDVSSPDDVASAFRQVQERLGQVSILVNAASVVCRKGVLDMTPVEWDRQMSIILGGAFLCTQEAANAMRRSGTPGSIVNIISTAGHQGEPRNVGYSTAKAGLLNFTRSVAMELAEFGIRVNSVTPTSTDPAEAIAREESWAVEQPRFHLAVDEFARTANRVPLRRLPGPRHYAAAVNFLVSDDAEMITGTDLRVDAGTLAKYWRWDPDKDDATLDGLQDDVQRAT
jgi:NAD(P)-dependent dehydrogenase (short-subunit alcohol dehydrogenase family)